MGTKMKTGIYCIFYTEISHENSHHSYDRVYIKNLFSFYFYIRILFTFVIELDFNQLRAETINIFDISTMIITG